MLLGAEKCQKEFVPTVKTVKTVPFVVQLVLEPGGFFAFAKQGTVQIL